MSPRSKTEWLGSPFKAITESLRQNLFHSGRLDRGASRPEAKAPRLVDEYAVLLYLYNIARRPRNPESQLHNRLVVLRAERGLSRQQLADAIAVNVQTVGYLERGDYSPSLELAFRLAEHFQLPIESIFAREPFAPMSQQLYAQETRP